MRAALFQFVFVAALVAAPAVTAQTSDAAHQQFVFAYRLLQRGEQDMAAKAFDEFLGKFPTDEKRGDAMYYRAMLARQDRDLRTAKKLIEDVPETKFVPLHAVQLLQGQVYTDLRDYRSALAALEKIRTDKLDPTLLASVLYMKGVAARETDNLKAAESHLSAAAQIKSALKGRALLDLARVRTRNEQPKEALDALKQCIELNDPALTAEAARFAGDLAYNLGNFDDAISHYERVITDYATSSHFGPAVLGVLWSRFANRQYDAVHDSIDKWKDKLAVEQRFTAWYLNGSAYQEEGRHKEAVGWFDAALRTTRKVSIEDNLLYKKAVSAAALKQYDWMEDALALLRKRHPGSPRMADALFLEAVTEAERGKATSAAAKLTSIIEKGPTHQYYAQAILERAKLYELNDRLEPAAEDYRAYLALESNESAETPTKSLHYAGVHLLAIYATLDKHDEAAAIADELLGRDDLTPLIEQEVLYRKAVNDVQRKQFRSAMQTLRTLFKKHPENLYLAEAHYYRGLLTMSLESAEDALDDLRRAADAEHLDKPLRINALRLVAVQQLKAESWDDAAASLKRIEKLAGLDGLRADEKLWLARHMLEAGQPRETGKYVTSLLNEAKTLPRSQQTEAWMLAARSLKQLDDFDAAIKAYQRVIARGGQFELNARVQLADAYAASGQIDQAVEEYKTLFNVADSAIAANAMYSLGDLYRKAGADHASHNEDAKARDAYETARSYLLRLILTFGQGEEDKDLKARAELSPRVELAMIDAAEIARTLGLKDKARDHYAELAATFSGSPYGEYGKAMVRALDNKPNEAASILRQIREKEGLDERLARRVRDQIAALER